MWLVNISHHKTKCNVWTIMIGNPMKQTMDKSMNNYREGFMRESLTDWLNRQRELQIDKEAMTLIRQNIVKT